MSTRRSVQRVVLSTVMLLGATLSAVPAATTAAPAKAPAATTNILHLRVESTRAWAPSGLAAHQAIPHYHWLVVQDDTGDPTHYGTSLGATDLGNSNYACKPQSLGGDPAYPANCQWPAIHSVKGGTSAEVVAEGDETTLNETTGIDTTNWPNNDQNPNRSYMITVMADPFDIPGCTPGAGGVNPTCHADGFKIDGQWFTLPLTDTGLVTVDMQPYPLPLLTVRMAVWNDLQTNGAYDTSEPNLQGFEGHIADVLGPVTTDWYGNPICTTYQHDSSGIMLFDSTGSPLVNQVGGHCYSDANGVISIPYLGPDRYSSTVTPPDGQDWFQTTTLEGWHDWDTWSIEGWNGYDPEFVQGAEPFPFAEFGFVQVQSCAKAAANPSPGQPVACPGRSSFTSTNPTSRTTPLTGNAAATGMISGTIVGTGEFSPQTGGFTLGPGQGRNIIEKINQPLISLLDTNRDDNTVYVGRGNPDGSFQITHIPDGDYVLAYWDEDQAYMLTQTSVSIRGGQVVDMGVLDIAAWHSRVQGRVCFDSNRNGKCDPGEQGVPNLTLNLLGRDNALQFYGDNTAVTDNNGNYIFPRTYPLGQWVVTQGYWEQYYTVGVTYQTNNQPNETTVMANGGFVDVSTYNLFGMVTRLDWAIHTYETNPALGPVNGGIVGEIVATTTRNELDARFQVVESYEPGLPGAQVHLYAPVKCVATQTPPAGTVCTLTTTTVGSAYYLTQISDGSYVKLSDGADHVSGNPIDLSAPYESETWQRPQDCVARDANGNPVPEQVLPPSTGGHDCLEAPLMSSQVGNNNVGDFMKVNGNYGFTQIDHDPTTGAALPQAITIPQGDYIVEAHSPTDFNNKILYDVTKEEDVNIFSGDQFVAPGETPLNPPLPNRAARPQVAPAVPPFPCVGPLHTVNVVSTRAAAQFDPLNPSTTQGVYNPDMVAGGGSPYEGQRKPLCDARLVTVRNGRSATPNFHFKAVNDVPLPGRIIGLIVDDLNLSVNPKELFYGEKYGIPNVPIGIYDFSNRLVKTVLSDPHGVFEVELPSTSSYNCPLPAGPCPGIYRFLGNDPGQPGHPNPEYNPGYRTIAAFFEVWPGITLPADLAPTPVTFSIENPGTQQTHPAACLINDPSQPNAPKVPELFAVSKPYIRTSDTGVARNITIKGQNFGATQGTVTLDGTAMPIVSWNDQQIVFTVATGLSANPRQLLVHSANGQTTANGLTFHVLGTGYNPTLIEVGPGLTGLRKFDSNADAHAIQHALDSAASINNPGALVVVYPATPGLYNPLGSYYENVIMHSRVKLQGVGPGGIRADSSYVPGTVLDGVGYGTDGERETFWAAELAAVGTIIGPNGVALDPAVAAVPEGEVILAVANSTTQYTPFNTPSFKAGIDGMLIQNGDVMDFVPNTASLGNGTQIGGGNNTPTNPNQGGGIVAFASTTNLQITNNVIRSNAGAYAGAIRLGTPLVGDNNLDGVHIAYNRILNNGGTNLAGAVGIFNGANGYEINNNDLCGNFSAEYGGAISHFGLSPSGSIHDNRIYFNGSYDEGGGVIIAGEPPLTPTGLSAGAGAVDIYNNLIEANMANDDGGGLRFLTAGNFPYNVYNNIIVNNISAHEGGGVAIDNAPKVRFYNNTVMKNLTTATAATSNGEPAPAGLSTALNNDFLQATLPAGSPLYSNPLLFNNIFWDNRAGNWDPIGGNIVGIGGLIWENGVQVADPTPINHWDMGVPGTNFQLSPTNSVLQSESINHNDVVSSPTNRVDQDPLIKVPYDATVYGLPWRGNPNFVANVIVAQDVPVSIMGDYHLSGAGSPAYNLGAASKAVPTYQQPPNPLAAPTFDIDRQGRPALGGFDSGADEFPGTTSDLSITKTDGQTTVSPGGTVHYTIVVANSGPDVASGASVVDTVPSTLTSVSWTCAASAGSSCAAGSGSGSINTTVNLAHGGSATFILTGTLVSTGYGPALVNTATVAPDASVTDPNQANNSAIDTDMVLVPLPTLGLLDNFNRTNANTLNNGTNWSQIVFLGLASIRVNTNQAFAILGGAAMWNNPTGGFNANQGAAFTFANAPVTGAGLQPSLILKGSGTVGGATGRPANHILVAYDGTQVTVQTTNNGDTLLPSYILRGTFAATFASGDTLSAVAYAGGTVIVYKTSGLTTTQIGSVVIPTSGPGAWTQGTGSGRIGMQLPTNQRVDNFNGGSVTAVPGFGPVQASNGVKVYMPIMSRESSPTQ